MELRDYQRLAVDALWSYLRARDGNPCIVMPTGAGKSPTMAGIVREALTEWPGSRILVLAHVKELVAQNAEKLYSYWPEAPLGVYAAGLNRRDRFQPVLFASIQSVWSRAHELGRFDLVLVDEAHRIPMKGNGMYLSFLEAAAKFNPHLRTAGLTATAFRLGVGPVCGPDYVLNEICYEAGVGDLIARGYLCRLTSKPGLARPDLSGVHQRGGEYVERELGAATDTAELVDRTCDEICAYAADRNAWIVFCVNVAHAEHVAEALRARGVPTGVVHSKQPGTERDLAIARFQRGELRALCNVNVLSEGFDAPHIDCVALLRATKSAGLYYQQVGRGLRLHPSKSDCLVLDFAGNIEEHGPIDKIRVQPPRVPGRKGDVVTAPQKLCPTCRSYVAVSAARCGCGHEWPLDRSVHHASTATDAPILSGDGIAGDAPARAVFQHDVHDVIYDRYEKPGKPPSLLVTYCCGLRSFREWICLEHSGPARERALLWWARRCTGQFAPPQSITGALEQTHELRRPSTITVDESTKFPEITAYGFAADAAPARAAGHGPAIDVGPAEGHRPEPRVPLL